jgi:hypothetical protein
MPKCGVCNKAVNDYQTGKRLVDNCNPIFAYEPKQVHEKHKSKTKMLCCSAICLFSLLEEKGVIKT